MRYCGKLVWTQQRSPAAKHCVRGGFSRFMARAGQTACERFTVHWLSNSEIQQSVLAREEISGSLEVPFLYRTLFRLIFSRYFSVSSTATLTPTNIRSHIPRRPPAKHSLTALS